MSFRMGVPLTGLASDSTCNASRSFVVNVINQYVTLLVAVNSCDVLAYNKWLFGVSLVI